MKTQTHIKAGVSKPKAKFVARGGSGGATGASGSSGGGTSCKGMPKD